MYCSKCGKEITPGAAFCSRCGTPVAVPLQAEEAPEELKEEAEETLEQEAEVMPETPKAAEEVKASEASEPAAEPEVPQQASEPAAEPEVLQQASEPAEEPEVPQQASEPAAEPEAPQQESEPAEITAEEPESSVQEEPSPVEKAEMSERMPESVPEQQETAVKAGQMEEMPQQEAAASPEEPKWTSAGPVSEQQNKEKKKISSKAVIGIAAGAAAVVLALLIVIIVLLPSGGRYSIKKDYTKYYLTANERLISPGGSVVKPKDNIINIYQSADVSVTLYLDSDKNLYLVEKDTSIKIDSEVASAGVSFFGDGVAYVRNAENFVGDLYLYTVSNKKSVKIDKDVYVNDYVLSPDGKTVAYVSDCKVEQGWFSTSVSGNVYLSKKGKEGEKACSNAYPIAVTDGGKQLYYVKDGEKLYVNDNKIISGYSGTLFFNQKQTELIYNKDGSSYYYTLKAGEAVKLRSDSCYSVVVPAGTAQNAYWNYSVLTYGIDTFEKSLLQLGNAIWYVSDKGEKVEKLLSSYSGIVMGEDGKGLIYLDGRGDIHIIRDISKTDNIETLGEDLEANFFVASTDLKTVYYLSGDELYYLKKGKGVRIADGVNSTNHVCYNEKYGAVYFISDEELYYATTTSKSKERLNGEHVYALAKFNDELVYRYYDGSDDFWCRVSGKKKTEVLVETSNR